MDEAPGPTRLGGRYELVELVGSGGMGMVWRAFDEQLGREVAVKVLSEHLAADPAIRHRFEREARHIASLSHPNIVAVNDFGWDGDQAYLVMEYVEGPSLRQLLEGGRTLDVGGAACVAVDTLAALDHAHRHGLVHRDVKPGNILLTPGGVSKLADFGVSTSTRDGAGHLGAFVGTPAYASPEQRAGATVDERSDLYAVGCVLHQCLCGAPPVAAGQEGGRPARQPADPGPLDRGCPGLPAPLRAAVLRALDPDPQHRHRTAAEMRAAFEPFANAGGGRAELTRRPAPEVPVPVAPATGAVADAVAETDPGLSRIGARRGASRRSHARPEAPGGRRWVLAGAVGACVVVALAVAAGLGAFSGTSPPPPPATVSALQTGQTLGPGRSLTSPDHHFTVVMERDGDLVAFTGRTATWATNTAGHPGAYLALQTDGNLVVYAPGTAHTAPLALWSTQTGGNPGARLVLQDDGNVVLYSAPPTRPLWDTAAQHVTVAPGA